MLLKAQGGALRRVCALIYALGRKVGVAPDFSLWGQMMIKKESPKNLKENSYRRPACLWVEMISVIALVMDARKSDISGHMQTKVRENHYLKALVQAIQIVHTQKS